MFDFSRLKLLVCGEVGVDEYLEGRSTRKSPECDVPVINDVTTHRFPGMAGNLAQNLHTLGARVRICTVLGDDEAADDFVGCADADVSSLTDYTRPTTIKRRIVCNGRQLARLDHESRKELAGDLERQYVRMICDEIPKHDAVFIQDYGKGLWSVASLQTVIQCAVKNDRKVFVDPNQSRMPSAYNGAYLVKPNWVEAVRLAKIDPSNTPEAVARVLSTEVTADVVTVTLGSYGSVTVRGVDAIQCPAVITHVADVAGAGDTFLATLGCAVLENPERPLQQCLELAHVAASVVVQQPRTTTIRIEDLNQEWRRYAERTVL